jgi:hypothetical protein
MSALPPKADMCGATAHVCFGPKADIRAFIASCLRYGEIGSWNLIERKCVTTVINVFMRSWWVARKKLSRFIEKHPVIFFHRANISSHYVVG